MTSTEQQAIRPRPKRVEVRARIVAAAQEAFLRDGYQRANIGDIAAAAGFSKGAVYSNFGGKADLFAAVINADTSSLANAVLTSSQRLVAAVRDPAAIDALAADVADAVVAESPALTMLTEFRSLAAGDAELAAVYSKLRVEQRRTLLADLQRRTAGTGADLSEASAALIISLIQSLAGEHAVAPDAMPTDLIKSIIRVAMKGILQ